MRARFFSRLAAIALSCLCLPTVHAQVIDDIEIRREGSHAIVQFHFTGPVQLVRSVNVRSGDLIQVYYNYLIGSDAAGATRTERRIGGIAGLPAFTLVDEPETGTLQGRRLLIRFTVPVRQQVRTGRDRQSIELALENLGRTVSAAISQPAQAPSTASVTSTPPVMPVEPKEPGVQAASSGVPASDASTTTPSVAPVASSVPLAALSTAPAVAATVVPAAERPQTSTPSSFTISLQRSKQSAVSLDASIPAEFQNQPVFTSQRVLNSETVYEINLGHFNSSEDADKARRRLLRRFPQAEVIAQAPGPIATPPAPTAAVLTAPTESRPPPGLGPVVASTPVHSTASMSPLNAAVISAPETSATSSPTNETRPESSTAEAYNAKASDLLNAVDTALGRQDLEAALDGLNAILSLPNTTSSRRAQELIGQLRLQVGDFPRARAEFEHFLALYPEGQDSDRVRQALRQLPAVEVAEAPAAPKPSATTTGSISMFYFGGQSQVRSLDFQNSPINGLPVLQNENLLSGNDFKQLQTNLDLNWRYRDTDADQRFVVRDTATSDLMPDGTNRNRLTALYYEKRSFINNTNFRIGRQSPSGGGVMYRYDGIQAGYGFTPGWRINGVAGKPSDDLLDTKRSFYGLWLEAEALTKELSGNLYVNQGLIDGVVDRQAVGTELRYFHGGVSMFSQVDYDTVLQGVNIASLQGNWLLPDTTSINFMFDRRATPFRSLSNILFFQDPSATQLARRVQDLLQTSSLDTLRAQVNAITALQTQGLIGFTTPIATNWQAGLNVNFTNIGEISPVPVILPNGQPSTGDLWSLGAQLIGSNLYSARDTHIFNLSSLSGPTYRGTMLSYNNLFGLNEYWQLEPSLRYYQQMDSDTTRTDRITPGLRLTYHIRRQVSLETELTYEISKIDGPTRFETAKRTFYYFGGRYDF